MHIVTASSFLNSLPSIECPKAPTRTSPLGAVQQNIHISDFERLAQKAIDNHYKLPMPPPSEITVRNLEGVEVLWQDLTFSERQAIIHKNYKGGCTALCLPYEGPTGCEPYIPRWTHGAMHVVRAALIVRMVANMYNHYCPDLKITENEILIAQLMAIYHDSKRQAEGVDVWDDESAENMIPALKELGFEDDLIEQCVTMLKAKDEKNHSKSIISKLVQCGDCIDIMRIYHYSGFQFKYLDIFNDLKDKPGFCADIEALCLEFDHFITKTDAKYLRLYLEAESENYYSSVASLMLHNQGGKFDYPTLAKWYNQRADSPSETLLAIYNAPKSMPSLGKYKIVKTINEASHPCFILAAENGKLFFFKEMSEDSTSEEVGSSIANIITDGLVPKAEMSVIGGKKGVLQPYIEIDETVITPNFSPKELSDNQVIDLVVHMISDYVIRNYDSHDAQFGVDLKGRVISFDKGFSFGSYLGIYKKSLIENEPASFNPKYYWPPLYPHKPIYPTLAAYLRENPSRKKNLFKSKRVQKAFSVCENAKWDSELNAVALALGAKNLPQMTLDRAKSCQNEIVDYFS